MWRSVFLHRFIDEEIGNFQALPGNATPASLTLTPFPAGPGAVNSVKLTPGRSFEYSLAQPLDEVIGVSGRVRLWHPVQGFAPRGQFIMQVGDMAEFSVRLGGFFFNFAATRAFAQLRIGSTEVELAEFLLPQLRFIDMRFDWHTSGQARVLLDGRLLGYHNALAPAAQLEVANVTFGVPDAPASGHTQRFHIGRVFVNVLRRSDPLATISRLFPVVDVPDDDLFERCRVRAAINLLAMVDRLRRFMTLVNQQLSQPWSQESGPPEGPFSAEAKEAHELATTAFIELRRMLRTGDFSAPDGFLSPFTEFLKILHDALPNQFEALAGDLMKAPAVPDECRKVLEAALEESEQELKPLLELLSLAANRISEIAGGS
jgi:hypothetical protein